MVKQFESLYRGTAGIYIISHPEYDKFYIGSTKNLYARHYQHCADYKYGYSSKPILELSDAVGFNNLRFTVLEVCDNIENLKTMEQFYFNFFYDKLVNSKKIAVRNSDYDKK
jgi:group I intron endonuclease